VSLERVTSIVVLVVLFSLAAVLIPMNIVLLVGLFSPRVDNTEIFKIIGPSYNTVIGAFVGVLSGYALGKATPK